MKALPYGNGIKALKPKEKPADIIQRITYNRNHIRLPRRSHGATMVPKQCHRFLLARLCCLGFALLAATPLQAKLANDGSRGLYVRSIDEVLNLPDDDVDLGTAALIISEEWSDVVHGLRYRDKLDEMAEEIKKRLRPSRPRTIPTTSFSIPFWIGGAGTASVSRLSI